MSGDPVEVVKTHLEITRSERVRTPARPPQRPFELQEVSDPALNRWFYEQVGANYHWIDRLGWGSEQWRRWSERVETWVVVCDSQRAGYFELEPYPPANLVQLAYFGLLERFHGLGIGGHALAAALNRGLELGPKVAVSTNTRDSPHALANYEARGMRAVRRERGILRPAPTPSAGRSETRAR